MDYPNLKKFASFILEKHLDEFIHEQNAQVIRENLPLLKYFENLTSEELFNLSKKGFVPFLENMINGVGIEKAKEEIKVWKSGQGDILPDQVVLADMVSGHNIRKKIFLLFLKRYTTDLETFLNVTIELDDFYRNILEISLNAFFEFQRSVIQNEKELVETIINTSEDAIMAFDKSENVLIWNNKMEASSGITRDKIIGKPFFDHFPAFKESTEGKTVEQILKGEPIKLTNMPYKNRLGFYEANAAPLYGNSKEIFGGVVVVRDITERVKKEEELGKINEQLAASYEELEEAERKLRESNSILEQKVIDRTFELSSINEINKLIAGELDLDVIVQKVTDITTKLCKAQFGAFFYNLVNEKGEAYTLYTISGVPREKFSNFPMPRNTKVFEPTFHGTSIVRSDDITKDSRYGKNPPYNGMPKGHLPVRSYLAVPVISRTGEVLGGLFYGHEEPGIFTKETETIVADAASNISIAIDNSKLFSALKSSEKRFRFMTEVLPQIIWTTEPDGTTDYYNKKWYDYTGFPEQEGVKGWEWFTIVHPDDLEHSKARWEHSIKTGEPYQIEHRFLRATDKQYRWQLSRGLPLKDSHGNIIKWFGTSTDIHDERMAMEELRLQSRVLESMDEGVSVTDENGVIIYTNTAEDRMFGIKPGEFIGKNLSIQLAFPPDESKAFVTNLMEQVKTNGSFSGELKNITKDGKVFYTYSNITNLQIGNRNLFVAVQQDITEVLKNQEELSYQHTLNKTITDNTSSALFMIDKEGYCTFINPAGIRMFGYSFQEIIKKPLHQLIHHHHQDGSDFPSDQCIIHKVNPFIKDIKGYEDYFFRKDGAGFPVSCSASLIYENGEPSYSVIEVRDITEEKKFKETILSNNEELRKINNDLDNFIYTASHDLKSPVSNIEGLMNTMRDIVNDDSTSKEDLNIVMGMIFQSITRFKTTIQDLTEITKVQRNSDAEEEMIDICTGVEEVKESIQEEIVKTGAIININTNDCPTIKFSKKNFRSIIYNLISNGIKYRSPDKTPLIDIVSYSNENYYVVSVKDNGLGIKEEHKGKIFEMFKRVHDHVEGTGIGLYIVKRIIDNAGGKIQVDSKVNEGSEFKVYFKK